MFKMNDAYRLRKREPCVQRRSWKETLLKDGEGFTLHKINPNIGFGVFAKQDFKCGDALLNYHGTLITADEADDRTIQYGDEISSRYLFYFISDNKKLCIDGTHSTRLAKYINDSPSSFANCKMVLKHDGKMPHLCLIAVRDISKNEELRYDYGESTKYLNWRTDPKYIKPFNLADLKLETEVGVGLSTKEKIVTSATEVLRNVFLGKDNFKKDIKEGTVAGPILRKSGRPSQPVTRKVIHVVKTEDVVIKHDVETLAEPFCKIEDKSKLYRPIVFKSWKIPSIKFDRETVFEYEESSKSSEVTKCSRKKKSIEKNAGYCEICSEDYRNLGQHRLSKRHTDFVNNPENYINLDQMIKECNEENKLFSFHSLESLTIEGISRFTESLIIDSITMQYVQDTMDGTRHCWRHALFKQGSDAKRRLDYTDLLDIVPEHISFKIQQQILNVLADKSVSLSEYVIKVLVPDAIETLFAKAMKWSRIKSEKHLQRHLVLLNESDRSSFVEDGTFKELVKRDLKQHQKMVKALHNKIRVVSLNVDFAVESIQDPNANIKDEIVVISDEYVERGINCETEDTQNRKVKIDEEINTLYQKDLETISKKTANDAQLHTNIDEVRRNLHYLKEIINEKKQKTNDVIKTEVKDGEQTLLESNQDKERSNLKKTVEEQNNEDVKIAITSNNKNNVSDEAPKSSNTNTSVKRSVCKRKVKYLKCPVCHVDQTYLTRHLRLIHKWSWKSAAAASSQFGLIQSQTKKEGRKVSDYHYKRLCPVANCMLVRSNMPDHLIKHHKLTKGPAYYKLLKQALKYNQQDIPKTNSESPRKSIFKMLKRPYKTDIQDSDENGSKKIKEVTLTKGTAEIRTNVSSDDVDSADDLNASLSASNDQAKEIPDGFQFSKCRLKPKCLKNNFNNSNVTSGQVTVPDLQIFPSNSIYKQVGEVVDGFQVSNIQSQGISLPGQEEEQSQISVASEKIIVPYRQRNLSNSSYQQGDRIEDAIEISKSGLVRKEYKQVEQYVSDDNNSTSSWEYRISDEDTTAQEESDRNCLGPDIEALVTKFASYMIGPDRNRKIKSVSVVASDLRRIFRAVNVGNDMSNIFKNGGNNFRQQYLIEFCKLKGTKATSIKKYLYSLKEFCEYLIAEDIEMKNIGQHEISTMVGKIQQWRKNYKREERLARYSRMAEDQEMLVDKEQVKNYNKSRNFVKALSIIDTLANNKDYQLSQTQYCLIRDYLYVAIHFTMAQRSGVTANMTIKEFGKAKVTEDRQRIIDVWDHKTVQTYGPAKVVLSEKIYTHLKIYVDSARIQTNPKCDAVFLSWSGKKVTSGDISKRLHLSWVKAGNYENKVIPKHLSANIVRKSASTGLREANSQFVQEVANLMAHSKRTADEHYYLRNMEKAALVGTATVTHLFQGSNADSSPLRTPCKRKVWSNEDVAVLQDTFELEKEVTLANVKEKIDTISSLNVSPRQVYDKIRRMSPYKLPVSPMKRRSLFSKNDLASLKEHGADLIKGGSLTWNRIKKYLQPCGLTRKYSFMQLRTRINYERSKKYVKQNNKGKQE